MRDHSNESYWAVLSSGAVYLTAQGGSNFWVWWNPKVTIQMKAIDFPEVLFIMLYKVVLTFESVDEILKCDYSNESYWAVLSCGTVVCVLQGGSNFWVCLWNPKVCDHSNESYWAVLSFGTVFYAV